MATYFSVWHFWVQRIWPHGHFWKSSKQLPRPFLGPAQQVRSMILIGCLPSITMGLAKRAKNDWKLLFWAEFQMSFWVQRKWAIILQNVTNKHGLKCVDRMSTRSWRLHTVTGITYIGCIVTYWRSKIWFFELDSWIMAMILTCYAGPKEGLGSCFEHFQKWPWGQILCTQKCQTEK